MVLWIDGWFSRKVIYCNWLWSGRPLERLRFGVNFGGEPAVGWATVVGDSRVSKCEGPGAPDIVRTLHGLCRMEAVQSHSSRDETAR
jgi:hypothetical protein